MNSFVAFLQECDLFFNLTETQLILIENICEEKLYQRDELIFEENSNGKELYLILTGSVKILLNPSTISSKQSVKTTREIIALCRRGQSFGEMALIDEGVRSASAIAAEEDTRLLVIQRKKLLVLCGMYPEIGYKVMQNLCIDLARKIRSADFKIREVLMYHPSPQPTVKP
jgi:CRP/FNR family cyclic AMP-dependent transcriptional regulator